jgi:ABC-type antimicrobial peptide transport system permease subunit
MQDSTLKILLIGLVGALIGFAFCIGVTIILHQTYYDGFDDGLNEANLDWAEFLGMPLSENTVQESAEVYGLVVTRKANDPTIYVSGNFIGGKHK